MPEGLRLSYGRVLGPEKGYSEEFFNKKKKIGVFFWTLIFVAVIAVVIYSQSDEIVKAWGKLVSKSGSTLFFVVIIMGMLLFPINDLVLKISLIRGAIARGGYEISYRDWVRFATVSFFISSVTPFSIGSEPYAVWWLKRRGVDSRFACTIVSTRTLAWFAAQMLITTPSFLYITYIHWSKIVGGKIDTIYWFILVGLAVELVVGLTLLFLSVSNRFHYLVMSLGNNTKWWFNRDFTSRHQLKVRYLWDSTFKRFYMKELFSKSTLRAMLVLTLRNLYFYGFFSLVRGLVREEDSGFTFPIFMDGFNVVNVVTTANDFSPLPSQEGGLQLAMTSMEGLVKTSNSTQQSSSSSEPNTAHIFIWRFFEKYLGFITGLCFVLLCGFKRKVKI